MSLQIGSSNYIDPNTILLKPLSEVLDSHKSVYRYSYPSAQQRDTFVNSAKLNRPSVSRKKFVKYFALITGCLGTLVLAKKSGLFQKLKSSDLFIPNLHEVIDSKLPKKFFRGGQPDFTDAQTMARDISSLKEKGVATIIDLRNSTTTGTNILNMEKDAAKNAGMNYINMPMSSRIAPTQDEVNQFISNVKESQGGVYVHCKAGIDRTGIMTSAYGIKELGWDYKKAYSEMKKNGFNIKHRIHCAKQNEYLLQQTGTTNKPNLLMRGVDYLYDLFVTPRAIPKTPAD